MALPKINTGTPSEVAPGEDPNQKLKKRPGVFSQFTENIATSIRENTNPMNMVRTGTYNAFGNNFLTRTGLDAMDALTSSLGSPFRAPQEDKPDAGSSAIMKSIEMQTKVLMDMHETLNRILQNQGKFFNKEEKKETNFTDLHAVNNGPPNDPEEEQKKKKKISPSRVLQKLNSSGEQEQQKKMKAPDKCCVDTKKILASISVNVTRIREILSTSTPLSTAESEAESSRLSRRNIDVEDAKIVSESKNGLPQLTGGKSSWWTAAAAAAGALFDLVVDNFGKIKEFLKKTIKESFEKMSKVWDEFKNAVKSYSDNVMEWLGKKTDQAKEIGGKAWDWLKKTGSSGVEKLKQAKIPQKLTGVAERVVESKIGSAIGKQALKTGAKMASLRGGPVIAGLVTAGITAYDAYDAYSEAEEVLDIKGRNATTKEKFTAAGGGAIESLSFGIFDRKDAAKWIEKLVTTNEDKASEMRRIEEELKVQKMNQAQNQKDGSSDVTIGAINNKVENNYAVRRETRNGETSFNRYMDNHYAF